MDAEKERKRDIKIHMANRYLPRRACATIKLQLLFTVQSAIEWVPVVNAPFQVDIYHTNLSLGALDAQIARIFCFQLKVELVQQLEMVS